MGSVVELTPLIRRITAPNPGAMTGDGTNTYLIGRQRIAVIDPGPAIDSHIDAIIEAAGDRLQWIIVTHTHADHSPAARILADLTGAPCLGRLSSCSSFQDQSFVPDRELTHNQRLTSDEFSLRAIHTPGHVDNHFCFLVEEEGVFIAGDHLMNGSTVVIVPPQGDMKAYIESLQLMLDYPIGVIAPGHGELIDRPRELVEWTIAHRMQRETKVLAVMRQIASAATTSELVVPVYDDVDPQLHAFAEYSLLAHLLKLEQEGRVLKEASAGDQRWVLA